MRWMRDGELLRWTMSSVKSLRLGGGREADGVERGFPGFGGPGLRMDGAKGEGGAKLRDALVRNVG